MQLGRVLWLALIMRSRWACSSCRRCWAGSSSAARPSDPRSLGPDAATRVPRRDHANGVLTDASTQASHQASLEGDARRASPRRNSSRHKARKATDADSVVGRDPCRRNGISAEPSTVTTLRATQAHHC